MYVVFAKSAQCFCPPVAKSTNRNVESTPTRITAATLEAARFIEDVNANYLIVRIADGDFVARSSARLSDKAIEFDLLNDVSMRYQ